MFLYKKHWISHELKSLLKYLEKTGHFLPSYTDSSNEKYRICYGKCAYVFGIIVMTVIDLVCLRITLPVAVKTVTCKMQTRRPNGTWIFIA